jgi:hypothetical protein
MEKPDNVLQVSLQLKFLQVMGCTQKEELPPLSSGTAHPTSTTFQRAGLEASIESNWDVDGVGEGSVKSRDRVVRTAVCDIKQSHDEIVQLVHHENSFFEKWESRSKCEKASKLRAKIVKSPTKRPK